MDARRPKPGKPTADGAGHDPGTSNPPIPNDLEPYWMPFTANRGRPRLIVGAKDMHYIASDGRKVIDGSAGLWCTNAGHNREPIVTAIQREAATSTTRRRFSSAIPRHSSLRAALRRWRRAISITCFSAIQVRKRSIRRSRSRWPIIMSVAMPRAPDRPRARLSRRRFRRHCRRWHRQQPQAVWRAVCRRRSPANNV